MTRDVKRVLYVLAGNHKQFENYRYERNSPDLTLLYISGPNSLRQTRQAQFVRVGTWYDRSDLRAVEETLLANGGKEVPAFVKGMKQ